MRRIIEVIEMATPSMPVGGMWPEVGAGRGAECFRWIAYKETPDAPRFVFCSADDLDDDVPLFVDYQEHSAYEMLSLRTSSRLPFNAFRRNRVSAVTSVIPEP
jgi:hypothetical protein